MAPSRLPALSLVKSLWSSASTSVIEILRTLYERFHPTLESDRRSIINIQTQDIPSLRRQEERVDAMEALLDTQAVQSGSRADVQQGGGRSGDQGGSAEGGQSDDSVDTQVLVAPPRVDDLVEMADEYAPPPSPIT